MKVKIDEKLICIPPHISVTWDQISFLQSKEDPETKKFMLILHLTEGKVVEIPNLDSAVIDIAFSAHQKHMEKNGTNVETKSFSGLLQQLTGLSPDQISAMPIRFGISGGGIPGMENLEMAMQHNQAQADAPDMPPEVLGKISEMAKMMMGVEAENFPKPEPHCNCMHCQLARTIHNTPKESAPEVESVSDADLQFRSWEIHESGDKMFVVTNPLDSEEQYTVYLGNPVGCTCGHDNCEHIKAVLYS